ncbi:hypothetical protein [Pseudomonas sp. PDM09]|uniref:hypothetical protein n=1 Tax=Pseudomonas sp. PDM09 TaxID=2769270 RepID=UPI00177F436F|nr:hypothetical protein [Pseudomonas sp. PDM09]MBD9562483.1 hypothetical protein [Pseudomonas sp. PDM09]
MRFFVRVVGVPALALMLLSLHTGAETIRISGGAGGCEQPALTAAYIMHGRQYELPIEETKSLIPDYDPIKDETGLTKKMFSAAELYPVEETREGKEASVKQFSTFFRVLCFDAYRKMQQANQKQGSGQ